MTSKESLIAGGELIEAIADNLLIKDNDLLKDIPVLGTVLGGINFYTTLKAKMFEKKVYTFLYEFNPEELNSFKQTIKKKDTEDLGFEVLNVIDNVDKINQIQMIARATKQYISYLEEGKDTKYIFDHNIHIIRQLDDYILSGLHAIYGDKPVNRIRAVDQALFNLGLLQQKQELSYAGAEISPGLSFESSTEGACFYKNIVCGD
ncbi:hypothetical protein EC844_1494 [Acinetobacter calcoaceticus]|uniref:Uncharacterized protein n=1 Tax=Acinetobacter calcoaceticus TaxID=471 RepID=A0A4R1XD23_ACICA|nr:hypothetical protein EC844_1494 [Acinetobacter calcoaceticus]